MPGVSWTSFVAVCRGCGPCRSGAHGQRTFCARSSKAAIRVNNNTSGVQTHGRRVAWVRLLRGVEALQGRTATAPVQRPRRILLDMRRASPRAYPTLAGILLLLAVARSTFALPQTWDRAHRSLQTTIELVVERGPDYRACWSGADEPPCSTIPAPTDAARSVLAALLAAHSARAEMALRLCTGRGSAGLELLASVRRGCISHASADDPLLKSTPVHLD